MAAPSCRSASGDGIVAGMRHARAVLLVPAILASFAFLFAPSVARADVTMIVLGLTSVEGDDDYARSLTGALRNEASRVPGWHVSEREVTLAQMSLAHGCGDVPDSECLRQIATTLNAQRLLYGTVRREDGDFHLTLSLFDAETGQIERSVEETLSGRRTDIDDLREPARGVIAQLSGPVTGALRIASNTPGATVRVDGGVAGTTDADGAFEMPAIPVGEHSVEVSAEGMEPWTGRVTIARGTEMTLDAELAERTATGGESGGPSINWAGIALIAAGALSFGVTVYSWARIEAIESDSQFQAYRSGWPDPPPRDVCTSAERGVMNGMADPGAVADLCSEASTLEVLQYVFLGVAVAAAGTGAVFLATGIGGGGSGESESVSLLPSFGPEGGRLTARIRF